MAKQRPTLIQFKRTDTMPSFIFDASKELADHFKIKRTYLPYFCKLIQVSKRWNMENLTVKLNTWIDNAQDIYPKTCIQIIKEVFQKCESDEHINKLRGAMLEALVIAAYGGTKILEDSKYGWGALVKIETDKGLEDVYYTCADRETEGCRNRSTVDFGYWNGYHGKFYECKVSPKSVSCKEKKYMTHLKEMLDREEELSYDLIFLSANTTDSVQLELDKQNLNFKYKAVGYDTLFNI